MTTTEMAMMPPKMAQGSQSGSLGIVLACTNETAPPAATKKKISRKTIRGIPVTSYPSPASIHGQVTKDYLDILAPGPWGASRVKKGRVVLDPERQFGRPIDAETGVPTSAVYDACRAGKGQDQKEVANWFGIPLSAVQAAVAFELSLIELKRITPAEHESACLR
ncbi:MAG TPA: hypothetical protein VG125_06855 [Pirellulales bacterium]|nr:hypothetical protein [Pirellulales bacterium]